MTGSEGESLCRRGNVKLRNVITNGGVTVAGRPGLGRRCGSAVRRSPDSRAGYTAHRVQAPTWGNTGEHCREHQTRNYVNLS